MIPDRTETSVLLDEALAGVAVAFQGMTAHEQESNCECHWGSAEELALLKTPDVPLDDDLFRRTYWTMDWHYPGLLLRRILPQVTQHLVDGRIVAMDGLDSLANFFAVSPWHEWPREQQAALRRFLNVWWVHVLVEPDAKVPAHAALSFLAEATTKLTPWLADWAEALADEPARRHLVQAMDEWMYDLRGDSLPWSSWHDIDAWAPALQLWVIRHAPTVLREYDASAELIEDIRRFSLPDAARYDKPLSRWRAGRPWPE
ncbi:hypothetical protein [Micromonospora sp. C28ISP2-4]|uniref:hypothetical protein n=1 Tax=Micromonospora sp. C28ISP2-4 TaxID=3059523 RepID=UPI0026758EF7|nr:hypothetical protein [Micromonospora sp. C28ISP2-4]MDO3683787.1 hypothetical protein [Micromonospora sp. C28ISP2-4]